MNNMINLLSGILFLLLGASFLLKWYKNRNKTDINALLYEYDKNKYEIVDENKLLKLQNIKYLLNTVCCFSIGILGLYLSYNFYLLGIAIIGTLRFIFDGLSKQYVKLKILNQ